MNQIQLWISVLEIGCFFSLIALGYLLILVGAGFFNFALGPYAMAAALSASWLVITAGVPIWVGVLAGLALAGVLGVATEYLVIRPVQRRSGKGDLPALIAVAAVLFTVQQLAGVIFGRVSLPGQRLIKTSPIRLGKAVLQANTALLIGLTIVIFVLAALWMKYSRTGRLLRAVGDNIEAATLLGLPVQRVRMVAFLAGGIVVGMAGILFAPKAGVSFTSGLGWTLTGFLALVIGGTGSVWAPLAGGLLLGLVQVFTPYYIGFIGPQTVILVLGLLFFAFRPQGLFVRRVRV